MGLDIAKITKSGIINIAGLGAVQGEQAGCPIDGWHYCSGDIKENRDYYCDIIGDMIGNCEYNILSSVDCSTKLSEDTNSGIMPFSSGTVTNFISCLSGSCTTEIYEDYCSSSTILVEYYADGNSYDSTIIDCSDFNYLFCLGTDVYLKEYSCQNGACDSGSDILVQTCTVSSPSYSSWSCINSNTRSRTITTYSPICNAGTCQQTSSTSTQTQTCSSGTYCNSGNCVSYTYSWDIGSWSGCSVNCGSGIETRLVNCRNQQTNEIVDDSFCSGTKPATSQSCSGTNCQSCDLPWGGSISHGNSIIAFQSESVPSGSTCNSQTRNCNDGNLDGSYIHSSCSPEPIVGGTCNSFAITSTRYPSTTVYHWSAADGHEVCRTHFGNEYWMPEDPIGWENSLIHNARNVIASAPGSQLCTNLNHDSINGYIVWVKTAIIGEEFVDKGFFYTSPVGGSLWGNAGNFPNSDICSQHLIPGFNICDGSQFCPAGHRVLCCKE